MQGKWLNWRRLGLEDDYGLLILCFTQRILKRVNRAKFAQNLLRAKPKTLVGQPNLERDEQTAEADPELALAVRAYLSSSPHRSE